MSTLLTAHAKITASIVLQEDHGTIVERGIRILHVVVNPSYEEQLCSVSLITMWIYAYAGRAGDRDIRIVMTIN